MCVAISLGSNLGDRLGHLQRSLPPLEASIEGIRCSAVYESEPMCVPAQPLFLNACCVGSTRLAAGALLSELKRIERKAGRRPGSARFGPRELDLDLLLYEDAVVDEPGLRVPHPRMAERAFVLRPLAEIAAEWVHPENGRTIAEMAGAATGPALRMHASAATLATALPGPA